MYGGDLEPKVFCIPGIPRDSQSAVMICLPNDIASRGAIVVVHIEKAGPHHQHAGHKQMESGCKV